MVDVGGFGCGPGLVVGGVVVCGNVLAGGVGSRGSAFGRNRMSVFWNRMESVLASMGGGVGGSRVMMSGFSP